MLTGFTPADAVLLMGCHETAVRLREMAMKALMAASNEEERSKLDKLCDDLEGLERTAGDCFAALAGRRP